jgi:hypothetical protein
VRQREILGRPKIFRPELERLHVFVIARRARAQTSIRQWVET